MTLVFVWLTSLSMIISRSIHVAANDVISFFFYQFSLFLFIFLAALGLCCCVPASSSCGERGLLFIAVCGLLIAVASLLVEHGL